MQLLEDTSSYSRDAVVLQMKEKESKKRKVQGDKQTGEEMRKAAMELIGSMLILSYVV